MRTKLIFWLFVAASVANIVAQVIDSTELNRFTKPMLMPLLLFYVYESSRGKVTLRVLLLSVAIFFSWLGDVALMYQSSEIYFLVGIGLFLIAQLTYILVLRKSAFQPPNFEVGKIWPFALYAVVLFAILLPEAGDFMVPILVYGIVISAMAGTARLREGNTSHESYQLALYGSILFVLSDSILAVNKFYAPIPFSQIWVMATYLGAQYLLVVGILKHVD